jgi:putative chitinase
MATTLVEQLGPAILRALAGKAPANKLARQQEIIQGVGAALPRVLPLYDIVTPRRIEHFLAQAAHESDGFCTTEEYASGARYEGRGDLGNVRKGDGVLFKGRGVFQLTGRANYREFGALLGIDLEAKPQRAAEPELSLTIACLFWRRKNLNVPAEADDVVQITRLINGGRNGLDDRRRKLGIAKREVAALLAAGMTSSDPAHYPVLRRGSADEEAVEDLQARLRKQGFILTIDGDFGAATELAVRQVQIRAGLVADGIVGPATWKALIPPERET